MGDIVFIVIGTEPGEFLPQHNIYPDLATAVAVGRTFNDGAIVFEARRVVKCIAPTPTTPTYKCACDDCDPA